MIERISLCKKDSFVKRKLDSSCFFHTIHMDAYFRQVFIALRMFAVLFLFVLSPISQSFELKQLFSSRFESKKVQRNLSSVETQNKKKVTKEIKRRPSAIKERILKNKRQLSCVKVKCSQSTEGIKNIHKSSFITLLFDTRCENSDSDRFSFGTQEKLASFCNDDGKLVHYSCRQSQNDFKEHISDCDNGCRKGACRK